MTPIRLRQWLAVLLLLGSVAALVWALRQSDRAVDVQGPGALVTTSAGQVWVGVDDRLWRLDADGRLRHDDALDALGLPGPPSTLNRHPGGAVVATVRDNPTLYLLDPARAGVRRTVTPQWPADLARHGGRAINLALHPDGRIAIATGGGHAVALFDAEGRFLARTTPELYRFSNGLWWDGDALWTTDTNRTQLKRLDGRTLALQQTVTLDAGPAARYLGPARAHPADAARVALIRFRNGMTHGRVAVLAGHAPPQERALPQAHEFDPVDVDWIGDDVLATDAAGHQLLRIDAATGLARVFTDGPARQRLAEGLQRRDRLWLHWKLGLVAAGGLLLLGFVMAWQAQSLQRRADAAARPLDLAYLGTPRPSARERARLTTRVVGPWALFVVPVVLVQVVDLRGWLGVDRGLWRVLLGVLTALLLALGWALHRRQRRLALDPAFEPVFNAQAVARLEQGQGLRQALRPDETVLETASWLCPTLHWLVLTDLRLLCFVATLKDHRLVWAHPRAALRVAWLARAPQAWSRWIGPGSGGPGWLQLTLPDGRLVQGRITAPTVALRLVRELQDEGERSRSAALPPAAAVHAGHGPGPWTAACLSLLVPGLGQWLQRRSEVALLLFLTWALFVTFTAVPALWAAWTPTREVPTRQVLWLVSAWAVTALVAAWDAWRMAPRRG